VGTIKIVWSSGSLELLVHLLAHLMYLTTIYREQYPSYSFQGVVVLDLTRAKEIMESPSIIKVTYRSQDVHIDQIFETTGFAKVHYENGTEANAALAELQEPNQ
jgi:H-type small acid-soluble spore protein